MQIGCCMPVTKYDELAKIGYDYVEFPAWQVAEMSEEDCHVLAEKLAGSIPCIRLNAFCRGTPAIVGDAYCPDAAREYAEKLAKNASILGVQCIGIGSPAARKLPEGYDMELADRQCVEFVRITARAAAAYGIDILLEAVHRGFCNYLNATDHAMALVNTIAEPNVRLVVDLYNMALQGEDISTLGRYIPLTRHLHVSTAGEGLARGLYGDEDADACLKDFEAIAATSYRETVSIEPDAAALTVESAAKALDLMRRTCDRLGI